MLFVKSNYLKLLQTTGTTRPQSFKGHLSSNSSHKEQTQPLALLQNQVQGEGEGSCKKRSSSRTSWRWLLSNGKKLGFCLQMNWLNHLKQSSLPCKSREAGEVFSLTNSRDTIQSSSTCKNLSKITPWVSYFWKVTIIQENAWAKFSITAIYSQLCSSTKRQIKHAQYFANMCFKTALQDVIAVVAF